MQRLSLTDLAVLQQLDARRDALEQVSRQSGDSGGFRLKLKKGKWRSVPGLTEALKDQFYPHYRAPRPPPLLSTEGGAPQKRNPVKGWARGRRVHEGLEAYVNAMDAVAYILTHAGQLPDDLADRRRVFEYMSPKLHPMVKALARAFEQWSWIPLYSEFFVFDQMSFGRATKMDMIIYDAQSMRFGFIELKTGYRGIFTRPGALRLSETAGFAAQNKKKKPRYAPQLSAEMEGGMARHRVSNSPLNQAFLQLIASTYMFSTVFGDIISRGALWVVHVEDDDVPAVRRAIPQDMYRNMMQALIQNPRLFVAEPDIV